MKAVPMLHETEYTIHTKGCPRCKTYLGLPTTWKGCPPPPRSTEKEKIEWKEYLERHYAEVRASIK
jgi:hypothetical protein